MALPIKMIRSSAYAALPHYAKHIYTHLRASYHPADGPGRLHASYTELRRTYGYSPGTLAKGFKLLQHDKNGLRWIVPTDHQGGMYGLAKHYGLTGFNPMHHEFHLYWQPVPAQEAEAHEEGTSGKGISRQAAPHHLPSIQHAHTTGAHGHQ